MKQEVQVDPSQVGMAFEPFEHEGFRITGMPVPFTKVTATGKCKKSVTAHSAVPDGAHRAAKLRLERYVCSGLRDESCEGCTVETKPSQVAGVKVVAECLRCHREPYKESSYDPKLAQNSVKGMISKATRKCSCGGTVGMA